MKKEKVYCNRCDFYISKLYSDVCYKELYKEVFYKETALEPVIYKTKYRSIYDKNQGNRCKDYKKRKFGKMTFIRFAKQDYLQAVSGSLP